MAQKLLYTNIKSLYGISSGKLKLKKGSELANFERLDNAWLLVSESGTIENFGNMETIPEFSGDVYNCKEKFILPCFVDSHTHLIHAGSREHEFVDRIKGLSYEQIASRGGGILNSASKLNLETEDDLFRSAYERLQQAIAMGTGAIEIKSGYGLNVANELKMLRVANRLKAISPIPIKITFLGAHALLPEFKSNSQGYINQIINEMLPVIGAEKLADYIDVFCETNYFSVSEMEQILDAGSKYGLKPKVHVNQFNSIGAVSSAIKKGALSVDHLEVMSDEDYSALRSSETIPVALPACSFFIKIPYAPARKLIDSGLALTLASDYNPGSSPCLSMPFVVSLACIQMGLLPEEAFNAATINGAAAIELSDELGSIEIGKRANFIITKPVPSLNYLPYSFAESYIDRVVIA
jgi:imidazolonepropionase